MEGLRRDLVKEIPSKKYLIVTATSDPNGVEITRLSWMRHPDQPYYRQPANNVEEHLVNDDEPDPSWGTFRIHSFFQQEGMYYIILVAQPLNYFLAVYI